MSKRIVYIRADGDSKIGMGHIYRCMALADVLGQAIGRKNIRFFTKNSKVSQEILRYNMYDVLSSSTQDAEFTNREFIHLLNEQKSDCVVVNDLIATSCEYMRQLTKNRYLTVNLDDTGDGASLADCLVQATIEMDDYDDGKLLMGPRFVLLRQEFREWAAKPREVKRKHLKLLVTMGGSDPYNFTSKVLRAIEQSYWTGEVTVILGPASENRVEVEKIIESGTKHYQLIHGTNRMAELMYLHDLAVFAGGTTRYELAAVGTPAITLTYQEIQDARVNRFAQYGTLINLGIGNLVQEEKITQTLNDLQANQTCRNAMGENGKKTVDGRGAERLAEKIIRLMEDRCT